MEKTGSRKVGRPPKPGRNRKTQLVFQEHLLDACKEFAVHFGHSGIGEFLQALVRDYVARGCPEVLSSLSYRNEIALIKDRLEKMSGEKADYKHVAMPVNRDSNEIVNIPEIIDPNATYYLNGSSYIFSFIGNDEPRKGNPLPADAFTYEWWGGCAYIMELDSTRNKNFIDYIPDDGKHNPFFPDPLAQMEKERGTEVYRVWVDQTDSYIYFRKIDGRAYFCDHNGYGMLEYSAVGLTDEDSYCNVYLNKKEDALFELRELVKRAEERGEIQLVVSYDYQYWLDDTFMFNPNAQFIES